MPTSIDTGGRNRTRTIARLTGLAYLGLLIFGPLGFMVIRGSSTSPTT